MLEAISLFIEGHINAISIIIGIGSFILSFVAIFNSKSAKKIAKDAENNITSLFRDKKKTGLIQEFITRAKTIREILTALSREKRYNKQNKNELTNQLNALSDEKKVLEDCDIEQKIDKIVSLKDHPEELLKEINVFISDLKLIKDRNDYSKIGI